MNFLKNILVFLIIISTFSPVYAGGSIQGPTLGRISSQFGYRSDPFTGYSKLHKGLDIAGPAGSPIFAMQEGVVAYSGVYKGYGNAVIIDHFFYNVPELPNLRIIYGHNRENIVRTGDYVVRGQVLARMGSTGHSTGPHLHFEVIYKGQSINPIEYLQKLPSYLAYADNVRKSRNYVADRNQYNGKGGG